MSAEKPWEDDPRFDDRAQVVPVSAPGAEAHRVTFSNGAAVLWSRPVYGEGKVGPWIEGIG